MINSVQGRFSSNVFAPNFKSRVLVDVDVLDRANFIYDLTSRLSELTSEFSWDMKKNNVLDATYDIYVPSEECSDEKYSEKTSRIKYDGNDDKVIKKLGLETRNNEIKEYKRSIEYFV